MGIEYQSYKDLLIIYYRDRPFNNYYNGSNKIGTTSRYNMEITIRSYRRSPYGNYRNNNDEENSDHLKEAIN
jgi:hypothetical protein